VPRDPSVQVPRGSGGPPLPPDGPSAFVSVREKTHRAHFSVRHRVGLGDTAPARETIALRGRRLRFGTNRRETEERVSNGEGVVPFLLVTPSPPDGSAVGSCRDLPVRLARRGPLSLGSDVANLDGPTAKAGEIRLRVLETIGGRADRLEAAGLGPFLVDGCDRSHAARQLSLKIEVSGQLSELREDRLG
jgi:hypothetical protein